MLANLAVLLAAFTGLWLVSLRLRDASIADIWWGPSFLLSALVYFQVTEGVDARRWLVLTCVTLWAVRLAWHIGARHRGEDARYGAWRTQHGASWWWRSYFQVFVLQGLIAWVVSWPLLAAMSADTPASLSPWDISGLLLFTVGFLFEAIADAQLRAFRRDPANRGQVLDTGLWRYSRHPNYFGETVLWWGLGLMAAGTPGGWVTLISPALMTFLLLRVSGVTMLESALKERKPAYHEYVRRTSAFVPWPPAPR